VRRFNARQSRYRVRAVAMPGANLDLKLLLSVAGGDPPDVMNHDEPVVGDWASRGVLTPIEELASPAEMADLGAWLLPAAAAIGRRRDRMYALVNGLDVRALYFNKTALRAAGLADLAERGPRTLADLDRIAATIAPPGGGGGLDRVGYLPDPRRLWAWGVVFGGSFGDPLAEDPTRAVTPDDPGVVAALEWMAGYRDRYGPDRLAAFRSGDQALTGASFPLLADRRYAVLMDGQWRVRDLAEAAAASNARGGSLDEFGVCPLPPPPGGVADAGWVNANYFLVPRGARNAAGAWEFMKFWCGFGGAEEDAAETAVAGGWIPASRAVIDRPRFQRALDKRPLMREFVRLASSASQRPTPALPVAGAYYREVVAAAQDTLYRGDEPRARLKLAAQRVQARLIAASGRG
ncbi:MAG: extracellular solute-binding protein, partial [Planctomycetota bacterium]